jgi:predicted small secreted protein
MNPVTISGLSAVLFASVLLTSCATTGATGSDVSITQRPDAYQQKGTVAVNNDIKSILTAGGLDTSSPMSPVSSTKKVELAKTSGKSEIDQLVANLQAPGPAPTLAATAAKAPVPAKQQLAAKPVEVASASPKAEPTPSAATAMVEDQGTVTEETFEFPTVGPNLKPGQKINLEPMTPPVVPANVSAQLADPSTFKQVPVKKAGRTKARPAIVYAEPSVRRF